MGWKRPCHSLERRQEIGKGISDDGIVWWKSYKILHKSLRRKGFKGDLPKIAINKWKNSKCYHIHKALPNEYFEGLGLFDLTKVKVEILSCYRE